MRTLFKLFSATFLLGSCAQKEKADLILHHAKVYTVDSGFSIQEAVAVRDGKILATGSNEAILDRYEAKEQKDLSGKFLFPGFIDAHCHFYGYGKGLKELNLVGTVSFEEVIARLQTYAATADGEWITGRGWDQNDWATKEFPDRKKLDSLFPDRPVFLKRVDGHAALANGEALRRAGISASTSISGGEIQKRGYKSKDPDDALSGILIDNAVDLVEAKIPAPDAAQIEQALLAAEKNCVAAGLTTVDDAGLDKAIVDAIDRLHSSARLKLRIYAMLTPSPENLKHYLQRGPYKTGRLNIRSFKFYGDGALGSRGACLLQAYADKKDWKGFLLSQPSYYAEQAVKMAETGFQMNTHCIGDSAVRLLLGIYQKFSGKASLRWRIEHAQVIARGDLSAYGKYFIPSVQPTHATSDMYWAGERLGAERLKNAYAYKDLLDACGMVALGTDFPVEDISPLKTFYAAVFRKDGKGFPEGGFQMENALSREQSLRGMTIWAAFSNFEEKEKGSIEPGKVADFVILDTDLMNCAEQQVLSAQVLSTFISGEEVYKK